LELANELKDEIRIKDMNIKRKKSDLAKEAFTNGVGRKEFIKYILD
jgi:hypothetical protein